MNDSAIGTLAIIALLTSTIYLAFTVVYNPDFEEQEGYYLKTVKTLDESNRQQPAFVTFFPGS